jgi:hypothetical protein
MFPDRVLTLLVFFVIPVSMRARTLLWISLGLAAFGILVPHGPVADGAHLGGILTGVAYVRWRSAAGRWHLRWPSVRPRARRELVTTATTKGSAWRRAQRGSPDDLPTEEFISREVDPILDKISAHGIQSLTERERRILEAARAKMSRR